MVQPVRALAGVALIGVAAAIAFNWWEDDIAEASDEVREPVRTVRIANDSGDVKVVAGATRTAKVHQRFDYTWNEPESSYSVSDGELVLDGCGWNCSVDYTVEVPRGTTITGDANSGDIVLDNVGDVDVHADSGSVQVRRANGDVRVEASSGDVELTGVAGTTQVDSSSGEVRATGLRGRTEVNASSGDISLGLDRAQDVVAHTSSGRIQLTVPDQRYRVQASTEGDERIGVRQSPDAAHLLDLDTSSGDLQVTAR